MKRLFPLALLAVFALTACGGSTGSGATPYVQNGTAPVSSSAATTSAPAAALPAAGTVARAKWELRDKFGSQVVGIDQSGGQFTVGLKWIGNSTSQLNAMDAFRQVFKDAGWAPKEMLIQFHGVLVAPATGAEHDGIYAVYDMTRKQAAQIVWANQDQVDWTHFRTMQRSDL
jgi:hypothetical protein